MAGETSDTGAGTHGPFAICPECGAETVAVSDSWSTNMYCVSCETCWRFTMGWVSRVDPDICERCVERDNCLAAAEQRVRVPETRFGILTRRSSSAADPEVHAHPKLELPSSK